MRGPLRLISLRSLGLLVAVAVVLLAVDAGSVMLTRMSEPDDVRTAGYAAAAVAKTGPTTRQVAVNALARQLGRTPTPTTSPCPARASRSTPTAGSR